MNQLNAEAADADGKVRQVVALLDELLAVIEIENQRLASGLPASLAQSVARKTQLAGELEGWLAAMRRGELGIRASAPPALATVIERLTALRALMDVNTRLIRSSMRATRRRIDAIMEALRGEQAVPRAYGDDMRIRRRGGDARGSQWA